MTMTCFFTVAHVTQGQPWTDVGNKFRQHELGMERRFPTTHFPFRLLTTMWGMVLVSAAQAFKYFHPVFFWSGAGLETPL